jgi:hypothetical protein
MTSYSWHVCYAQQLLWSQLDKILDLGVEYFFLVLNIPPSASDKFAFCRRVQNLSGKSDIFEKVRLLHLFLLDSRRYRHFSRIV